MSWDRAPRHWSAPTGRLRVTEVVDRGTTSVQITARHLQTRQRTNGWRPRSTAPANACRTIPTGEIDAILEDVGAVDTGRDPAPEDRGRAPRTARRLYRVREGKELAGVCAGLAAYSEIPVDWVRKIFVLGTLVTAGLLGLVYLALAFILPIEARCGTLS
jgi:phage shock protein C